MWGWLRLYGVLFGFSVKARAAYGWSFFLAIFFQTLVYLGELAAVVLIVNRVGGIGGWGVYQIMFLFGLATLSAGFYRLFGSELHLFEKYLVNGEFDQILTRPVPSLIGVVSRSVDLEQGGAFLQGALVLGFAATHLGKAVTGSWTFIPETLAGVLSGGAIWMGVVMATAAIGFWTTQIDDLLPVLLYGPEAASSYPLSIYPKGIQAIFYSVLPIAFGSFVPAVVILKKGLPPTALLLAVGVAAIFLFVATRIWEMGVRRYTSTGT